MEQAASNTPKSNANDINHFQSLMPTVWEFEQDILDKFHHVCVTHNLCYSLAHGTLLGAVRHKGFIPWDDDIDVMMPRADYDKLLQIWNDVAPEGYILENGNISIDCANNFSKIVKDKTTFLSSMEDCAKDTHKGIYIDIFPGDRLAPSKLGRVVQYCVCAVNLLYSRGYTSKSGGIIECIERVLLCVPRKHHRALRSIAQRYISKWNSRADTPYIFPYSINECKKYYTSELFSSIEELEFNGKYYRCTTKWDKYLRLCYGNYMDFPPVEDRVWKHHPVLIDFEHNCEELSF